MAYLKFVSQSGATVETAETNIRCDPSAVAVIESQEARLQIVADDGGNQASGLILTNAPSTGDNKHWVIQQKGPNLANKLYIGYKTTSEASDVAGLAPGMVTIDTSGNTAVSGDLNVSGSKSAVVNTANHGQRKLYAFEQASNRFADEGQARLANGSARVNVDPIFLETIEGDFLIHVTPYGSAVLYVAETGEDYFVVRAREGSDDVAFAWMLTAARKGYAGVRLEEVE